MTEYDRGTRAHRITPSMLQQSERNNGSCHKSADFRPVSYKLSRRANGPEEFGPEELPSSCFSRSAESR